MLKRFGFISYWQTLTKFERCCVSRQQKRKQQTRKMDLRDELRQSFVHQNFHMMVIFCYRRIFGELANKPFWIVSEGGKINLKSFVRRFSNYTEKAVQVFNCLFRWFLIVKHFESTLQKPGSSYSHVFEKWHQLKEIQNQKVIARCKCSRI